MFYYNEKVLEHFLNPRNVGEIPDADGVGMIGDPSCGDYLKIFIKVDNGRLVDVKFKLYGCPAAIGTTSVTTELAMGRTLAEAYQISDEDVLKALGGLPDQKIHCSVLGPAALRLAILDCISKAKKRAANNQHAEPAAG
ncbi:MAG: iron-sulfur cluster assembly scaffold protein [Firmicutes bacterium]|nr:iron-sulfur cluster assembly scaffold protein [Bacillota bacterium]MDH7496781.1 iron-sulfur cluster assembly scaffold protein [Bacillota bacterium]